MKNKIFQKVVIVALFSFLVKRCDFANVFASEMPVNVMQPTVNILEWQEFCLGYIFSDFVETFNRNRVDVSIENIEKRTVEFPVSEDDSSTDESDYGVGYLESCGAEDFISVPEDFNSDRFNQIGNGYSVSEIEDSTPVFEIEINPHTELYK